MKPADRARLTAGLQEQVALIAGDLRAKIRAPGSAERARAEALRVDEKVSEDFEVWTDLLSRRAAVLWVLKSVYVRVLEDRGLLSPGRLLDREAQDLFERLAPNLGETAFLRWVYVDLASPDGGLPELFSPQPAEVALPSDERSRALIAFWRHKDADSGATWNFAEEKFEGELMGDLYQELDPVVKDRYALCQTPDFVREFILDRTLTPAIEEFGVGTVRLLDPACGSGHFLIDGLKRLVAAGASVEDALERVVGIDLNDYACALARARLVMTAAELAGVKALADAARFHPQVYCADGLEQVERDGAGEQLGMFVQAQRARASLTRPEVRAALRPVLEGKFHAVVANPPYIVESDDEAKKYHREKTARGQRYISAHRQYSLASPFTERCFQLAVDGGWVGLITSNNFMKREFGKPLVEKLLAKYDLFLVADTSQAHIPFHGTPTILLFARNRPWGTSEVRVVMGKRGELGTPPRPSEGRVWTSLLNGWAAAGFENEFVSVSDLPRSVLSRHPWSLGGGGAADLKARLDRTATPSLPDLVASIGRVAHTGADEAYVADAAVLRRHGVPSRHIANFVEGDKLRDWALANPTQVAFPYEGDALGQVTDSLAEPVIRWLWPFRSLLWERREPQGTHREIGFTWHQFSRFHPERYSGKGIGFAFVATHNHFVFDAGGKVFNRSAPAIKLRSDAAEADYLALLGLLNSSTACFWMKQVFHCKGAQGINEGAKSAHWEQFYEHDATKLKHFPVPRQHERVAAWAKRLDGLASRRTRRSVSQLLASDGWISAVELRECLDERRQLDRRDLLTMVGLQEELDWLCYNLYGLDEHTDAVEPDAAEPTPPTCLSWLLNLAERDAGIRAALARGEDPGELPTAWFERHRWEPVTALPPEASPALRARVDARRKRIAANPSLALIETAAYKRRWYQPDYAEEEREAMEEWLTERIERAAEQRAAAFSLERLVGELQDHPRVLAVAELLTGRTDFHLGRLVDEMLTANAVPNHPFHRYKEGGLVKRAAWENTWAQQRLEDEGKPAKPEVPPAYTQADFLRSEFFRHRGKLDVPKERFIAFTEVPGRTGAETLYGWAGWTPLQRIKAILAVDEELDDAAVPIADRIALLDSAWRLLPDAAREDASSSARLKAELQALVGLDGPSKEMLEEWRKRCPPPKHKATRTKKPPKQTEPIDPPED